MAATQPYGLACQGGLDINLSQLELLQTPGKATSLVNFEVDPDGGYRRINGYQAYGDTRPNGTNAIEGIFPYADGVIVCSGTDINFSNDGSTWIQINRTGASSGNDYTTFTNSGGSTNILPRTGQTAIDFVFLDDGGYGQVIIFDGANAPYLFSMTGTGALTTRTFFAEELGVGSHIGTGSPDDPTTGCYHKTMVIVAGISTAPNIIGYTTFTQSESNLTSSSSNNVIAVDDEIIALRSFRDAVIIFCKNSIHKLVNAEDSNSIAVLPITKNIGCLSRESIQEIGGDLIFLASDGFRTIAGTDRIGDVELGTVSRQIQPRAKDIVTVLDAYNISSVILRDKSQYRFFYSTSSAVSSDSYGLIGTLTARGLEWSETKGIQARAIGANFDNNTIDRVYHGDNNGYVYLHNAGDTFIDNEVQFNIDAEYQTPFLDFGDLGTRKTLTYIKTSLSIEGETQPTLSVIYDYEDINVPQPTPYILDAVPTPSVFGTALFGTGQFGGIPDPMVRQAVEGSGHTVSLKVVVNNDNAPFAVNGFYIDYYPSGRR